MRLVGPPLSPPRHPTLNAALEAAASSEWGVTFVDSREEEHTLPWRVLRDRAAQVAAGLAALGVAPGDRVAIVARTSPEFCDALFGALLAGAVPVPLYPPVRLGRLTEYHQGTARMLRASGAKVVLADRTARLLLGQAVAEARPPLGLRSILSLREGGGSAVVAAQPEALALVQFSSGSTVAPKPVALTHRQLMWQLASLEALVSNGWTAHQAGVSWLPLYHDMGLIGCLLSAVSIPGPLTLLPPELFLARPALWLRALSRHRATVSPAPNFAYAVCLKRIRDEELEGVDLSRWRHALCGAEPISAEVMARFSARFARWGFSAQALRPVYGLSEASLAVTFAPSGAGVRTVGVDAEHLARFGEAQPGGREMVCVGPPVPGAEVELRDAAGRVCPPGRVGRIFVRSPSVMAGYLGLPGPTAEALRDGWLDTGDLGFLHQGELVVSGRAKDLVIVRGANHAPQEFEECLEGLPGLRPGCAVAVGAELPGAEGEALVVLAEALAPPTPALEDRVRTAIVARTGILPHAVRLLPAGTLPRTSSGKLRRAEALRQFLEERLSPPDATHPLRLATEMAKSAWALTRSSTR